MIALHTKGYDTNSACSRKRPLKNFNLKEINLVRSLNSCAFRSLKEAVLNAINSKESLKILNKIRKLDIEALIFVDKFIITTQD